VFVPGEGDPVFPGSEELDITVGLVGSSNAESVGNRIFSLARSGHGKWALTIVGDAFAAEVGDTVAIEAPRYWSGTRNMFVRRVDSDTQAQTTVLGLIGGAS
jgi:hypothetical protein